MSDWSTHLPAEQEAIRAKCFHPSGAFVEIRKDEIEQSIPERFERIVARHADRTAVKTRTYTLTYDALNKVANRVARVLLRQPGISNKPVALLLDNDAPMIASLLGVLKAGKAYVSLDPSHPPARSSYVLEDSEAALILTDSNNITLADGLADGRSVFNIDELDSSLSVENLGLAIAPDALSAIRYTSGSTGQPKGTRRDHFGMLHHYVAHNINSLRICADDRIAAGSISQDLFNALLAGAAFYPLDIKKEGLAALPDWMAQQNITIYFSVPSIFRRFVEVLTGEQKFPDLRLLAMRGEALSRTDVDLYKKHFPETCLLVNRLGSNETGPIRQYFIDKQTDIKGEMAPAGYAVADKEVVLLDENGEEVGSSQIGEIAVKSRYVRPGYGRRADLTRNKYLADPDGGDKLIYLTGDLGRFQSDGCLEYLGRKDSQVKIAGNRIEVSEIENVLLSVPSIKEAVVAARQARSGEQQLVAYLVPATRPVPTVSALRGFLKTKLPVYMIPVTFVVVDEIPLTVTGKIDRRALPDPGSDRPELDTPYSPARTPVEKEVARIWAEVLSLDRVGVHDDFFELGGHSLAATRVVSHVINAYQLELPLQSLFQAPTVGEMASVILQNQTRKLGAQELDRILSGLESLSDEEAKLVSPKRLPAPNSRITAATKKILPHFLMDDLSDRIAKLSPAKRDLFELALRERELGGLAEPSIPRAHTAGPAPLSFAQQRLWFLSQLEPDRSAYNQPKAVRLSGALNIEALKKALDAIVCRHEVLRTTFTLMDGGIPVQSVKENRSVDLPLIDLSSCTQEKRNQELQRAITEITEQRFDLSRDLMIRMALLRLAPSEHVLLLVTHHIAFDGWSSGILWREIASLYAAFSTGEPNPLPDLPVQYADYAVWQRSYLQGEVLEKHLSYWKKQLSGVPVLELPVDRPRPSVQSYRSARQIFAVPKSLVEKLKTLSREQGATLFMILLAAFQILLHRYTGQEDIAVGSPIANRTRSEIEGLIGFFVNTLALRTDLSGNPSFRELLTRVRGVALGAYDHQDLPFEKLVEELNPERRLGQTPLFQVMFVLQNTPRKPAEIPGVEVSPVEVSIQTAKFDLTLSMTESADSLRGVLEYTTDLFEEATIRRMAGHFQTLLHDIAAHPDRRIFELSLLTETERAQLLVDWNDTKRDYPKDLCIHDLFEAQVERSPDAVALVFEDRQLTYRELNRRANQLAHHLQKSGVGAEARVGIYMERSPEMVVGLLGVLKAGGAYVPLDLDYPKERLSFMLDDSQAQLLVTQKKLLDGLPEWRGEIVCLDPDWERFSREPEHSPVSGATAENLAYVIYTSGSTGKPKGVAVPHRAVNRLVIYTNYVNLKPTDIVAQVSNCSFDAATFEIWGALLHGARLVGVETDVAVSPKDFAEQIEQKEISVLFLTTALFNQMARECPAAFRNLRYLLFGGEAVDPKWVAEVLKHGPPERLLHVYGPTETTTFASWYAVENIPEGATTIPIGQPIANTEMYLLDRYLRPVPVGVVGELCIGGDGLGLGYLDRPELTAERFIPNPFSAEPGARLYRTGDLVRYLPDGNIEFIGRIDLQVKIRGFRIELGEIESTLARHPHVQQVIVLAREDVPGDKRLVAYVVRHRNQTLTTSDLRSFLKAKLPDYMVCSAFVFLDVLPLTPNGKVDRRALPAPDQTLWQPENGSVAFRDAMEFQLTKIWEKVLGIQSIGIRDNFFELGGHSLLAVRLLAQIEKKFGKRLPLATLFQAPTVEQQAALLRREGLSVSWSSLVALQPSGFKPPFVWVHGENSNAFLPRYLGPDQPLYGLLHQGQDGKRARYTRIEDIAAHYLAEVRTVQPYGPYFLGGFCIGGMLAFEMAQQLHRQDQKVALLVLLDATNPGSFSVSPNSPKPLRNITLFREEVYRHLRNLTQLGPQKKLAYVLKQVKRGIQGMMERINEIAKRSAYKVCLSIGYPLPPTLQYLYREELYHKATQKYVAQPYAGRVIVFKTGGKSRDRQLSWQRLAAGGLEIYEVPGKHTEIVFKEPQIQGLAKQLKVCLDKAQARSLSGYNFLNRLSS